MKVLEKLHWVAYGVLRAAGYRWELRRSGELKIGLWRKKLNSKPDSYPPRRFVLVPGFGDTPMSWISVMALLQPVLSRKYDEIVLVDFPGYGGFLAQEKCFHSMDLLLSSTYDLFDSIKPHTILGHSLGGWLTAQYAAECGSGARPLRGKSSFAGPKKVMLANPSGLFANERVKKDWERMFLLALEHGFSVMRPHVFGKEPFWFKYIAEEFARFISQEEIVQFIRSVREDHLVVDKLKHVKSETWLIWGEKDTLIPSTCAPVWLKGLAEAGTHSSSKAKAIVLTSAGHSIQVEQPAITAAIVGQILADSKPLLESSLARYWWKIIEA